MKVQKIRVGIILAALILLSCTACNNNKSVPAMATVSSVSSGIEVSALIDTASSTVSSTAPASSSTAPAGTTSKPATTTGGSTTHTGNTGGGTSYNKPSGGNTGGTTGGNTGGTTKPSGGTTGGTTGGTATPTPPPAPVGIQTTGYASKYGCQTQDQYNYVRQKAASIGYSQADFNQSKELWSQAYSVPYSDSLNAAQLLAGSVPTTSGASENAYNVFASRNGSCVGTARAAVAILQMHGYNAKVVYGQNNGGANHAWVTFSCGGTWYSFDGDLAQGNAPAGYHIDSISYQ